MSSEMRLPCTAFEELMLAQDSRPYPCVIVIRMRVRGTIVRSRFDAAVRQMIERHPLLRSRIRTRFGRSTWEMQPKFECRIDWVSKRKESSWVEDSYVDIRSDIGFGVTIEEQGDDSLFVFQGHHAVVDGLGFFNAIHEIWLIYDALSTERMPKLLDLETSTLPTRNQFGLTWRKLLEIIPKQMIGLAGVRQFVMRRPKPLVAHTLFWGPRAKPCPVEVVSHRFDEATSVALRQSAKRQKVNLNDVVASCIFVGCEDFRSASGGQSDTDWLRMMVPVSMRSSKADYQQTACNIVSSVFLDRTPAQIRNREYLLSSIYKEMELIKANRLALMFIFSLWMRKLVLFRNRPVQPPSSCQASMVFTNVGKVYFRSPLLDSQQRIAAGGLVIEDVEGVAPLTPYMSAAFTAIQYAKQLTLSLRFDPRLIQREAAENLLDRIVAAMQLHATSCDSKETIEGASACVAVEAI